MRTPRRVALLTIALAVAVSALPAAYALTGGKWTSRTVNYYVNPANADVSEAAADAAIQAGAATWGSQSNADFRFYYMGRTAATSVLNNGRNEVFFRNIDAGSTIAVTYSWTDSSGRLLDTDIMFYDGGFRFFTGTSGCSGGIYLEDVAAHEFGHALGLGHSADASATMYYVVSYCSTSGRSLASDDLAGVEALYPPSGPVNVAPLVALTSPADGSTAVAPATMTLAASASDADGSVLRVDFLVNGSVAASDTSAPYSATLTNLAAGTYVVTAVATDNSNAATTSAGRTFTVSAAPTGPSASVAFVKTDTTTQGSWKNAYGSDGYSIVGDATSLPTYAQVTVSGQASYTWASSTTDGRALQRAGGDRVMAAWYGAVFSIDVTIAGTQPRQLAIYAADYDNWGRQQRFDVIDAATGGVLDSRTLANFGGGQYLVWNVAGHVLVRVTSLSGPNAVVSGLTLGAAGGGGGGTAVASFVKTDVSTQGNWKGTFGSEGYAIAADATSLPSGTQLTVSGQATYAWATSTSDARALQRAGSDRVMAAWYGSAFTIDVNVGGSQPRQVAIYAADYDYWGRQQRFDVIDAGSGAVLDSRTLANFGGGQFVVWNVQGHVIVRVTALSGPNAVVSGVLIGAGSGPPAGNAGAVFLATDVATQGTWKGVYGSDGSALSADATTLPAYAQVTVSGHASWVWAATTSDVRAVQRASSGRVMAASYGLNFTIAVNITDSQPRRVALYSADYDNGSRQQRFDVIDAATGALLDSRTLTAFSGGQYLSWNVAGHVVISVTALAGPNAVVSGIFFN